MYFRHRELIDPPNTTTPKDENFINYARELKPNQESGSDRDNWCFNEATLLKMVDVKRLLETLPPMAQIEVITRIKNPGLEFNVSCLHDALKDYSNQLDGHNHARYMNEAKLQDRTIENELRTKVLDLKEQVRQLEGTKNLPPARQVQNLRARVFELEKKINELYETNGNLDETVKQLTHNTEELKAHLQYWKDGFNRTLADKVELRKIFDKDRSEIRILMAEFQNLGEEVRKLQDQLSTRAGENLELQQKLSDYDDDEIRELRAVREDRDRLQQEFIAKEQLIQHLVRDKVVREPLAHVGTLVRKDCLEYNRGQPYRNNIDTDTHPQWQGYHAVKSLNIDADAAIYECNHLGVKGSGKAFEAVYGLPPQTHFKSANQSLTVNMV
jgi:hypothetical protein